MLPRDRYPKPDYNEDTELSEKLRCRRESEYAKQSPKIRKLTVLAPIAILSTVLIGFPVMVVAGLAFFVVILMFIIRINREGDKVTADCPTCGIVMRKEERAGLEYHLCDRCKLYARGRDWS